MGVGVVQKKSQVNKGVTQLNDSAELPGAGAEQPHSGDALPGVEVGQINLSAARPTIKAVLFDLDGTLLDTYRLILESFRHTTRAVLGTQLSDEVLMAKVGTPLAEEVKDFTDDPALQAELVSVYRAYNARVHDELVGAFPGVGVMLDVLRSRGLRMGVVTSKRTDLARRGLEVCGLASRFEFVLGSDECTRHKPDPEPVLLGCARLGVAPDECTYVGDSPFDIAAGNAAGCVSVAATWGMFCETDLLAEHPAYVAHAPAEVPAAIG